MPLRSCLFSSIRSIRFNHCFSSPLDHPYLTATDVGDVMWMTGLLTRGKLDGYSVTLGSIPRMDPVLAVAVADVMTVNGVSLNNRLGEKGARCTGLNVNFGPSCSITTIVPTYDCSRSNLRW